MKILKGIPEINYNRKGRPTKHDFSSLQVNEGVETTQSGVICAKRYGKMCGKVFVQRKQGDKFYVYRQS